MMSTTVLEILVAKDIDWGKKARKLTRKDICRGKAQHGKQRDLRGWIIEFFGENTRAAIKFEREAAEQMEGFTGCIEIWSDTAPVEKQVRLFNSTWKRVYATVQKGN